MYVFLHVCVQLQFPPGDKDTRTSVPVWSRDQTDLQVRRHNGSQVKQQLGPWWTFSVNPTLSCSLSGPNQSPFIWKDKPCFHMFNRLRKATCQRCFQRLLQ